MNCQKFILIGLIVVAIYVYSKQNTIEKMSKDDDFTKSLQDKINAKVAAKMEMANKKEKKFSGPDFQKMMEKKIKENEGKEGVVVTRDSQRIVDVSVDQKVSVEKSEDISSSQESITDNVSAKDSSTDNKQDESVSSSAKGTDKEKTEGGGFCECGNMFVIIALILALIYVFNYLNINKTIN